MKSFIVQCLIISVWYASVVDALHNNGQVTLKDVICKLGSRVGLSCASVTVVPNVAADVIEVRFKIANAVGSVLLTSGCQNVASSINAVVDSLSPVPVKENIIELFTNPELLKGVDSNQCTLIRAVIPQMGSSQPITIDCATEKCLTFKATPEGTAHIKIQSQIVTTNLGNIPIGFIINAMIEFDFRTAKVPNGASATFHAIPLPHQPNSATINLINQIAKQKIDESIQSLLLELTRGESNPNDVSLWQNPSIAFFNMFNFNRNTQKSSFHGMVCDLLQKNDLSCQSLNIQENDQLVEVKFEIDNREALIVLKSGCQTTLPPLYDVVKSIGDQHLKEIIAKVFTTPKLLEEIDSNKCTLIKSKLPLVGTSLYREVDCDGTECITFTVSAEGTVSLSIKNLIHRMALNGFEFRADTEVRFDFRTAKVPNGFQTYYKAIPLPNQPHSHAIDMLNKMVPEMIENELESLHNKLIIGEKNPSDVSLFPYHSFFHQMKSTFALEPKKTLKEVLCSFVRCETVKITKENKKLKIEFGEQNQRSTLTMKNDCEKTIIDVYNLFEHHKNGGMKEFLIALFTTTEVLKEVSSEKCSLYRAEYPTSKGIVTIDCQTRSTDTKSCIELKASPEGTTILSVENLLTKVPSSLSSSKSSSSQHQIEMMITKMNLIFDFRTAKIPNNQQPILNVESIHQNVNAEDLSVIQILNVTGKYLLRNRLSEISSVLRRGEKDPNNISLWPQHSINLQQKESFDLQMFHIVRFVSSIFDQNSASQIDLAQIIEDLLQTVSMIPKCLKQSIHSQSQKCPTECYEGLENLQNKLEIDSKNNIVLLDIARLIGYLTEETKRICNELIGSDWQSTPNPRPPFSVLDLFPVGIAGKECMNDLMSILSGNSQQECMKGCAEVGIEIQTLISKYVHVSFGQIVGEILRSLLNLCEETKSICYSVPEGIQQSCNLVENNGGIFVTKTGQCHHGRCIASEQIWF